MTARTYKLLLSVVFLFSLFFHEKVEEPFIWFRDNYGNPALNFYLNIFFVLVLLIIGYIVVKNIYHHPARQFLMRSWIIIAVLSVLSYLYLMPYRTEGIHFIQYGIMGALSAMIFTNYMGMMATPTILGIFDEICQYIFGDGRSFDFNDMVLNFEGGLLGVLLVLTVVKNKEHLFNTVDFNKIRHPAYLILATFCAILVIGLLTGVVGYYSDSGPSLYINARIAEKYKPEFWYFKSWGSRWHSIRPIPGLILLAVLPILFYFLKPKRNNELQSE